MKKYFILPEETFEKFKKYKNDILQQSMLDKSMREIMDDKSLNDYRKWILFQQELIKTARLNRYLRNSEKLDEYEREMQSMADESDEIFVSPIKKKKKQKDIFSSTPKTTNSVGVRRALVFNENEETEKSKSKNDTILTDEDQLRQVEASSVKVPRRFDPRQSNDQYWYQPPQPVEDLGLLHVKRYKPNAGYVTDNVQFIPNLTRVYDTYTQVTLPTGEIENIANDNLLPHELAHLQTDFSVAKADHKHATQEFLKIKFDPEKIKYKIYNQRGYMRITTKTYPSKVIQINTDFLRDLKDYVLSKGNKTLTVEERMNKFIDRFLNYLEKTESPVEAMEILRNPLRQSKILEHFKQKKKRVSINDLRVLPRNTSPDRTVTMNESNSPSFATPSASPSINKQMGKGMTRKKKRSKCRWESL